MREKWPSEPLTAHDLVTLCGGDVGTFFANVAMPTRAFQSFHGWLLWAFCELSLQSPADATRRAAFFVLAIICESCIDCERWQIEKGMRSVLGKV
jgi:hypothetical protein